MTSTQKSNVGKHGMVQGNVFLDEYVCKNLEKHLASEGSLDRMIILKDKRDGKNGTMSIPVKYVPDPDGDNKEYDLSIYSKDNTYVYGRIFNTEKGFAPELKQAKFTQSGFDKHTKDDKGYASGLIKGKTIEDEDINYNFRIREMLSKFLTDKIEQFKSEDKWGNPKDAAKEKGGKKKKFDVVVTNFELKEGMVTKTSNFEDQVVPYITFKFSEDEGGAISSDEPGRPDYKLKILDNKNNILNVSRDNINKLLPSRTRIKIVVGYKDLKITKFGISLSRYINNMRIEETPGSSSKFSFGEPDQGEEDVEKGLDFDDD